MEEQLINTGVTHVVLNEDTSENNILNNAERDCLFQRLPNRKPSLQRRWRSKVGEPEEQRGGEVVAEDKVVKVEAGGGGEEGGRA